MIDKLTYGKKRSKTNYLVDYFVVQFLLSLWISSIYSTKNKISLIYKNAQNKFELIS